MKILLLVILLSLVLPVTWEEWVMWKVEVSSKARLSKILNHEFPVAQTQNVDKMPYECLCLFPVCKLSSWYVGRSKSCSQKWVGAEADPSQRQIFFHDANFLFSSDVSGFEALFGVNKMKEQKWRTMRFHF